MYNAQLSTRAFIIAFQSQVAAPEQVSSCMLTQISQLHFESAGVPTSEQALQSLKDGW